MKLSDLVQKLYELYPKFKSEVLASFDEEEREIYYLISGKFGAFTAELVKNNPSEDFSNVAQLIEDAMIEGDEQAKTFVTIGIL